MIIEEKYQKLATKRSNSALIFRAQLIFFTVGVLITLLSEQNAKRLLATDPISTVFVLVFGLGLSFMCRFVSLRSNIQVTRIFILLDSLYIAFLAYFGIWMNVASRGLPEFHPNAYWLFPVVCLCGSAFHVWGMIGAYSISQLVKKK